jgi:hypothetical protein
MTTLAYEELIKYLHSYGPVTNPLLTLPPVSLNETTRKNENAPVQNPPDSLKGFIETILRADELFQISRFSRDHGVQTFALFSLQGRRQCGYLTDDNGSGVSLLDRADLFKQIELDFVQQDANETREIKKINLPAGQALVLATILDVFQEKKASSAAKTGDSTGVTRAEITKVLRSFVGEKDKNAPSSGKPVKIENYPLVLMVSTISSAEFLEEEAVSIILDSLVASNYLSSTGKTWKPETDISIFSLDPEIDRALLSLTHTSMPDGLLDTTDAYLVVNQAPGPAFFIRTTSEGMEWTAYSPMGVVQYLEYFLRGATSRTVTNGIVVANESERSGAAKQKPHVKKKISPVLIAVLILSVVTMLCSCTAMSFGLFLS